MTGLCTLSPWPPMARAPLRPVTPRLALTIGTEGPILILLDEHQVHEVSGGNELHGSRGAGGSAHAEHLSKHGGVQLPARGLLPPPHTQRLGNEEPGPQSKVLGGAPLDPHPISEHPTSPPSHLEGKVAPTHPGFIPPFPTSSSTHPLGSQWRRTGQV